MSWQVGLYAAAVLIPLFAFAVEAIFIRQLRRTNAYLATGAIGLSCLLSLIGFIDYSIESGFYAHHHAAAAGDVVEESASEHAHTAEAAPHRGPLVWSGSVDWVIMGGSTAGGADLAVPLGIAVDNLTAIMFLMVTFIATLIHIYSMGYMHDDPRYPRFFTYLSLFCFSMLGLVASSNVFMIFMFWELVGVCSYLLIGFWYEEKPNSDAANKAFIVNRVGDVGMLVGLGLLWTTLGTFSFQEINQGLRNERGLNQVSLPEGDEVVQWIDPETHQVKIDRATGQPRQISFWMLTLAGLGIFAGCAGKSAQFPLHVWLPDAGVGADSRGDHGRRRGLPGRSVLSAVHR
jgi:NADH:ubiquinone oxidoreductase subunit 5 (subunit L)/multisubunit Na+/H+ antiporter MnhA subunit